MITERIQNAIDVFIKALENGTLQSGDCSMCAVGNLCRDAITKHHLIDFKGNEWSYLFCTGIRGQTKYSEKYWQLVRGDLSGFGFQHAKKLISYIAFTEDELAQIEFTFETNCKLIHKVFPDTNTLEEIRADQLNGLRAVVELMLEFDDCKEVNVQEVFLDKAELIPV